MRSRAGRHWELKTISRRAKIRVGIFFLISGVFPFLMDAILTMVFFIYVSVFPKAFFGPLAVSVTLRIPIYIPLSRCMFMCLMFLFMFLSFTLPLSCFIPRLWCNFIFLCVPIPFKGAISLSLRTRWILANRSYYTFVVALLSFLLLFCSNSMTVMSFFLYIFFITYRSCIVVTDQNLFSLRAVHLFCCHMSTK